MREEIEIDGCGDITETAQGHFIKSYDLKNGNVALDRDICTCSVQEEPINETGTCLFMVSPLQTPNILVFFSS